MSTIFVVHLIDFDGGRPGHTCGQWFRTTLEGAVAAARAEQDRLITKEQNPGAAGERRYSLPWQEKLGVKLWNEEYFQVNQLCSPFWINTSHGHYYVMYITKEELK